MTTRKTKIPAIRKTHNIPIEIYTVLEAMKQTIETREGLRGDPLDRFITLRDFQELIKAI